MSRIPRTVGLIEPMRDVGPGIYKILRQRAQGHARRPDNGKRSSARRLARAFAEEDARNSKGKFS
jgi:hypothetical protein